MILSHFFENSKQLYWASNILKLSWLCHISLFPSNQILVRLQGVLKKHLNLEFIKPHPGFLNYQVVPSDICCTFSDQNMSVVWNSRFSCWVFRVPRARGKTHPSGQVYLGLVKIKSVRSETKNKKHSEKKMKLCLTGEVRGKDAGTPIHDRRARWWRARAQLALAPRWRRICTASRRRTRASRMIRTLQTSR